MSVRGAKVASGLGGVTMRRITVSFCRVCGSERFAAVYTVVYTGRLSYAPMQQPAPEP